MEFNDIFYVLVYGDFNIKQSDAKGGLPDSAGTSRFYINPSGNVGIGTTSPGEVLEVYGTTNADGNFAGIRITGGVSAPFLKLYSENANAATRNWVITTTELTFADFDIRQSNAKGGSPLGASGTSRFYISDSGNVGIGTTNPASTLTVIGNFSATGTKAAVINTTQGAIAFYAMESTEVRLYDEGKATLVNGDATVSLDPLFAEVIDTSNYIVHLTPKGSSNGLYVEQQTPASFVVKENNAGTSSIEFSYLVSGKRKAFKDVRLYKMANFDFGNNTKVTN